MEEIKRTQMGKKTSLYNLGSASTASCVMMNSAFVLNFAFSRPHKKSISELSIIVFRLQNVEAKFSTKGHFFFL